MSVRLLTPTTVDEAIGALAAAGTPSAVALAGGTDLLLDLEDGRVAARNLISLRRLPFQVLAWDGPRLTIGSTLPLRRLERDERLAQEIPGLYQAVRAVGSVQLRHRATIGGNLGRASPSSDLIPVLLALEARVELTGPSGDRSVAVDAFLRSSRETDLRRGELIRAVTIPRAAPSQYLWQRVRPANDISQVGIAVARFPDPSPWRVALGGVVPRPIRLREAESVLQSSSPGELELEMAAQRGAEEAQFRTDRRATEAYRRRLVRTLIRRAVEGIVTSASRGAGPGSR